MLSGFGSSLSIKETTSDDEDGGGETGAILFNSAGGDSSVLRLALESSRRARGILAATYAQSFDDDQEIISVGDLWTVGINVGAADRYLIRGFSWISDDTTPGGGGFSNRMDLWNESSNALGTRRFSLYKTRNNAGLNGWTAPQGATVEGSASYFFGQDTRVDPYLRKDAVLVRTWGIESAGPDRPMSPGVTLSGGPGDAAIGHHDIPFMAVLGEPLYAMVQNLGQTNSGYRSLGGTNKVLSQGFTTGSDADGYELLGIGVNIEGSGSNFPDGPTSVSVAVDADLSGRPGAKLFDLVSPTEFGAGHSFFEAPRGKTLEASTSYVMVWSHLGGTVHRMRKTSSNSEDTGARPGFSMANTFYQGADLANMAVDTNSDVLEIAVYTAAPPPGNATGRPVVLASAQGAGILFADTEGIADEDGLPIVRVERSYVTFH